MVQGESRNSKSAISRRQSAMSPGDLFMSTSKRRTYQTVSTRRDTDLLGAVSLMLTMTLMLSLLLLVPTNSFGIGKTDKRKRHPPSRQLTRAEIKAAEGRLAE